MSIEENNIDIHICKSNNSNPHAHNFLELAYVLKGNAEHSFNESERQIISAGDYFIIDYNTVHSYKNIKSEEFVVINCLFMPQLIDKSLAYCKEFKTLLRHYLIQISGERSGLNLADMVFHDDNGVILNILNQMLKEYTEQKPGWIEIIRSKMIEILIMTARMFAYEKPHDIISDIILIMHDQYNKNLTLSELAAKFNYSLPYISKLFKEKTGSSFREYLQKIRIDEACRLLANTDEKVGSISESVGYGDIDFFCRIFKKSTGKTPRAFRAEIMKNNL